MDGTTRATGNYDTATLSLFGSKLLVCMNNDCAPHPLKNFKIYS